jgi:hypothetical protein
METATFANRKLRLAHRSIQRKKLYLRMSSVLLNNSIYSDLWPLKIKRNCMDVKCITKHLYSSDLWPLKIKRNCIVDKSVAVRFIVYL